MNLNVPPEVRRDILDLADWYDAQRDSLGDEMIHEVETTFSVLSANPRLAERLPRPPKGREIRRTFINRFPVIVVLEVTSTDVIILAVTHGKRRSSPWRQRLIP